jgi:hypothetical protein
MIQWTTLVSRKRITYRTESLGTTKLRRVMVQTPKLENHLLSVPGDCLFNTFAATHHNRIWRPPLPTTWRRTMSWWQESIYHETRYPSEWHCILTVSKGPGFVLITQPYCYYESNIHSMCTIYNTWLRTILFKNLFMPCDVDYLVALQRVYEHWNCSKFNNIPGDNARDVIYWNWNRFVIFRFPFPHALQTSDMTDKHPSDSHIPQ